MRRLATLALLGVTVTACVAPADAARRHHRHHVQRMKLRSSTLHVARGFALPVLSPAGASAPLDGSPQPSAPADDGTPGAQPGASTPGTPPPAPVVLPSRTGITLKEYSVRATRNPVGAGSVELAITNYGQDAHDLTVARDGVIVGQTAEVASQAAASLTLDLAAGSYKLYCSLLDGAHDQAGMHTTLQVK